MPNDHVCMCDDVMLIQRDTGNWLWLQDVSDSNNIQQLCFWCWADVHSSKGNWNHLWVHHSLSKVVACWDNSLCVEWQLRGDHRCSHCDHRCRCRTATANSPVLPWERYCIVHQECNMLPVPSKYKMPNVSRLGNSNLGIFQLIIKKIKGNQKPNKTWPEPSSFRLGIRLNSPVLGRDAPGILVGGVYWWQHTVSCASGLCYASLSKWEKRNSRQWSGNFFPDFSQPNPKTPNKRSNTQAQRKHCCIFACLFELDVGLMRSAVLTFND